MAKDDYDYIVYKVLLYLYGCFQRKYIFDKDSFNKAVVLKDSISEDYLIDVLRYMTNEGLIEGLRFKKVWGNDYILINDFDDMTITSDGIHYLKENSRMKKITETLLQNADLIADLIKLVLLP